MTTFDRHIIRRLLTGFAFFVGALILFFVVLHYVEMSDDFANAGVSLREIFLIYYPHYIPEIIRLTSPLAIFLSSVYVTGKLAQELQLVALQTSGVSLYRLLRPYVLVGVLVTGFMFWMGGWVVPVTNETVLKYDRKYLGSAAPELDRSNMHRRNRPGQVLTVGYYDADDSLARSVSLQRFTENRRLTTRLDAERMEWIDSLGVWRLYEGVERFFRGGMLQRVDTFAARDTVLRVYPRDLTRTGRDAAAMTIPQAATYVASLRRSGASHLGRPLVAYYNKFSYPLANLLLIIISVPLAAVRRRGGQAVRFGLALLVAFAYLALQKLIEPFGYSGQLSPLMVAWLPHLVFVTVAAVLLWRVRK